MYQPGVPAFADDAPFIHALIELDAGARIVGNRRWLSREEREENALQLNEPVEAVFEDVTDDGPSSCGSESAARAVQVGSGIRRRLGP